MDLKTYAVHRKLLFDDDLLRYVAKEQDIPASVVASSFSEFLETQEDAQAECLVNAYDRFLGETIPVVVSRDEIGGGYDVSGDIPDTVVDAIQILHGKSQEDIVKALVDYNLATVHGQECRINHTELGELTERTRLRAESIPPVVPVRDLVQTPAEEPDPDLSDLSEDDMHEILEPETVPAETDLPEDLFSGLDENVPETEHFEEPEETEPETESRMAEPDQEETRDFAAAIRNIYNKLCDDIRRYHLDTRLNLVM